VENKTLQALKKCNRPVERKKNQDVVDDENGLALQNEGPAFLGPPLLGNLMPPKFMMATTE
jgi:hypothetical protein